MLGHDLYKVPNAPPRWVSQAQEDQVPGSIGEDLQLGANNRAVVWLLRPASYSTGLRFEMVVAFRADALKPSDLRILVDIGRPPDGVPVPFVFPRLAVEFADGLRLSNLDVRDGEEISRVGLWQLSAGGDVLTDVLRGRYRYCRYSWYLSPLPSRGDLTFVFEWSAVGIRETRTWMSGDTVRRAAARAHNL